MKNFFASGLSFFFHPLVFLLLMPFFIIYRQTGNILYSLKWFIFSSVFIFIGIVLSFFGILRGFFSDFDISKRRERYEFFILMLSVVCLYLIASIFLKGIFFPLSIVSFGIVLAIIIFLIVNLFIKASIHVAVSCAFVISITILYGKNAFLATFWIVPMVSWARVVLKHHTIKEILVGGSLGSLITLLTYQIGRYIFHH